MNRADLEERTLEFAVAVVALVDRLPRRVSAEVAGRQVVRSGTGIGSNYREANRAESRKDFIHKIGIVEKEASETEFWFEVITRSRMAVDEEAKRLLTESRELLRIFTAIGRTTRRNTSRSELRDGSEPEFFLEEAIFPPE